VLPLWRATRLVWSSSTPESNQEQREAELFFQTHNTVAYPSRRRPSRFSHEATNNLTKSVNAVYYKKPARTRLRLVFKPIDYNKLNQLRDDFNKLAPAYINSGSTPRAATTTTPAAIAHRADGLGALASELLSHAINSASYINVTPNYSATTGGFGPAARSDHNGLATSGRTTSAGVRRDLQQRRADKHEHGDWASMCANISVTIYFSTRAISREPHSGGHRDREQFVALALRHPAAVARVLTL